jgi:cytochrome oxidase Cu insertion factor (SCO1/SenC/PrrC family)
MHARQIFFLLVVAGLVWVTGPLGNADARSPQVAVEKPAPDFTLTLLSGEKVHLADFRGKIVLLNFWAPW